MEQAATKLDGVRNRQMLNLTISETNSEMANHSNQSLQMYPLQFAAISENRPSWKESRRRIRVSDQKSTELSATPPFTDESYRSNVASEIAPSAHPATVSGQL
jgi:hypothetical protein